MPPAQIFPIPEVPLPPNQQLSITRLSHPLCGHPIFSRVRAANFLSFTNLDIAGNERLRAELRE